MTINTAAGSKLYIGEELSGSAEDIALSDFLGMSWTEIGSVEDAGEVGDQAADITFEGLSTGRVQHFSGSFDAGTERVVCAADTPDTGQIAITTAFQARTMWAFKLVLADRPASDYASTTKYYGARVLSDAVNVGNARNVVRKAFNLGINTAVFTVAPHVST